MKTIEINSADDFHKLIRNHWDSHYIYRGEDSDKYELRPKFGRDQIKSSKNVTGVERRLFDDFKRNAVPHLTFNPTNEWDWLAIAQHHGLHTRLLDWTENPLVAAFFAVYSNINYLDDAIIYIFNSSDIPTAEEKDSPFDIKAPKLYYPRNLTTRISAQSGLFTIHAAPSEKFDVPTLERVIIKKSCKIELWGVIETYNINVYTMFPDLDGLAKKLNRNWIREL